MVQLTMVRVLNNGHQDCGACFLAGYPDLLGYWPQSRAKARCLACRSCPCRSGKSLLPGGGDSGMMEHISGICGARPRPRRRFWRRDAIVRRDTDVIGNSRYGARL